MFFVLPVVSPSEQIKQSISITGRMTDPSVIVMVIFTVVYVIDVPLEFAVSHYYKRSPSDVMTSACLYGITWQK